MADQVRVGVIGTSWYADLAHLPRIKSHPHAVLAAVCGRNRGRAEEMAAKYGIPQVYTDYREMIAAAGLDAVVVSTPDDLHYPMTMAALDAELHVLCEKPLALTVAQAQQMAERAEATAVKTMVCYTWRWMPHYRHLQQLIQEGYVDRPFHVRFHYLIGDGRRLHSDWRFDGERSLGALGDLGSHMIDMARWLVGEVTCVSAHLGQYVEHPGLAPVNDAALLAVTFANGTQGTIQVSRVAHTGQRGQVQEVALYGAAGTLLLDLAESGSQLRGLRHDEQHFHELTIPDALWGDTDPSQPEFVRAIMTFVQQPIADRLLIDAILGDRPVEPEFQDGLAAQRVIEAAIRSHESGCWVNLPQSAQMNA